MRVAFADPPYPGTARRYYGQPEVDHAALLRRLQDYDGWALCTGGRMLPDVLRLAPAGVRVGIWCKPNSPARRQFNPSYAYDAVLFRGVRRPQEYVLDWIALPMPMRNGNLQARGLQATQRGPFAGDGEPLSRWAGQKPRAFCFWVFELLGLQADDELHDVFPGTGAVSRAWEEWRAARGAWRSAQDPPAGVSDQRPPAGG